MAPRIKRLQTFDLIQIKWYRRVVCVTGGGGYVASWLVRLLLSKDYKVHATLRDPSSEKNGHLMKLEKATESLEIFKADLLDRGSLLAAMEGCEGVFHTSCPVPSSCKLASPEAEMLAPAIIGTKNVVKACKEAHVRRLVFVSSVGAVYMNPNWPQHVPMDETCWSDNEHCKTIENWYCLAKTMAEEETLSSGEANGFHVVSVLPSLVIGPLLQSTVNTSSMYLLDLFKGAPELVENRLRHFVDVRDVAEALLLVYKTPMAAGRYICSHQSMTVRELIDKIPKYNYPTSYIDVANRGGLITSEKLKELGWKSRVVEETIKDSVECFLEAGLLSEK